MSDYLDKSLSCIAPYVPGEQPQDKKYIKLNTNENPYYTSENAINAITEHTLQNLKRYSDPESNLLKKAIADYYNVKPKNVLVTNGSDEALAFAFMAYCKSGVCFADVTYGFYGVIANLFGCPVEVINLKDDFTINPQDYYNKGKTVVIANPNAQTGIALAATEIEKIIASNKGNIVIIDQAYADFGKDNVIPFVNKYDNLVVVNTFSKSRSLAGARVGYVIANENLINDLNTIKFSFHPYNVNTLSMLLATAAIEDKSYFDLTVKNVVKSRAKLTVGLQKLNFTVLPSSANFVLAKSDKIGGKELYLTLKDEGILVRYFDQPRISEFVRITVGTDSEMDALLVAIAKILKEKE
jgi:histidinol-phosphate aminotransferase